MKKIALAAVLGVVALAGCAGDDGGEPDPAAVIEEYERAYNSDIEASGDTVTWDFTWTHRRGGDWCAEGNSAVIADGTIRSLTFAPSPDGSCT